MPAVAGHCLQAVKIVRHHANSRFDWLISVNNIVNTSREAISIQSGKHKIFTFVHPVLFASIIIEKMSLCSGQSELASICLFVQFNNQLDVKEIVL